MPVVFSGSAHDRGVIASFEIEQDSAFRFVRRGENSRRDRGCLRLLPIVIRGNGRALGVEKFQGWIKQRIRDVRSSEGRTDRAKQNGRRDCAGDDQSANHDRVARPDRAACADVQKPAAGLLHFVDFKSGRCRSCYSCPQSQRCSSRDRADSDRRFPIVVRREAAIADRLFLGIFPIVVQQEHVSARVVQFESRIKQRAVHTRLRERRSKRANEHFFRPAPAR